MDDQLSKIEDRDQYLYVHCLGGYRSMIATSIMKAKGYNHLKNVSGGWQAIVKAGMPVELPKFSES
jgi:rhodanese-related sulfurtransferase